MKSKIYRLSVISIMALTISSASFILLTGCAKNIKKHMLPPDVYYKKGLFYARQHNYSKSVKNFKALIENYPTYRNAQKAELKLGDAYFLGGKFIEAAGAYMDFIHLHPRSKFIPLAMYYAAMSYYKRKQATGRTASPLRHAKIILEELASKYPYSTYSKKALKYIKIINVDLSKNSFFAGLYYFNASLWKPAAYIFKNVLKRYPGTPVIPETLYYLAVCYRNLNDKKTESYYKNILRKNYPQSKYATMA
ncbi:MAG: outer membrane protein assembly factor BamD [Deltaproteobacteria bacterium]|nr:outer membrane protein assembly factor BamD [Deltaproteobacteria bacterium]